MALATRVPATFKIAKETKRRVDLMASALGVDKSKVIDEAVRELAARRRGEVTKYLDDARASLSSDETAGAAYSGRRRSKNYAGGPVR